MKTVGKVYKYGDHVDTDVIIPARFLNTSDHSELASHCMEDIDTEYIKTVEKGDIIVGGENFGCGSSREHAIWALRGSGVRAVIADSFARIFFRNAINNGFVAIESKGISGKVSDGDELEIDIKSGKITNHTKNEDYIFVPLSDFAVELMNDGGLINHIKKGAKK